MLLELVPGPSPHEVLMRFAIRNEGRGIARYIGAMCEFSADELLRLIGDGPMSQTSIKNARLFHILTTGVIHACLLHLV